MWTCLGRSFSRQHIEIDSRTGRHMLLFNIQKHTHGPKHTSALNRPKVQMHSGHRSTYNAHAPFEGFSQVIHQSGTLESGNLVKKLTKQTPCLNEGSDLKNNNLKYSILWPIIMWHEHRKSFFFFFLKQTTDFETGEECFQPGLYTLSHHDLVLTEAGHKQDQTRSAG